MEVKEDTVIVGARLAGLTTSLALHRAYDASIEAYEANIGAYNKSITTSRKDEEQNVVAGAAAIPTKITPYYDRLQELKAFDESKTSAKGMVDVDIEKIPQMFIRPDDELVGDYTISDTLLSVPVIDLCETNNKRELTMENVRRAAETLGFFQVVNHGIPIWVVDDLLTAVREFHELGKDMKMRYYTREVKKKVKYGKNFDLYESRSANWRNTLFSIMGPDPLDPLE